MNIFFKKLGLFFIALIIGYPILIFLSGYLPVPKIIKPRNINYRIGSNGHMFSRIQELKQLNGNIDILFLGSSHAYRGFDPRNFKGKKVFNLGSSAQTPIQTNILLARYLDRVNPSMVIYEVYPGTFESEGVESSLDLIANDKNDFKTIKMSFEINHIKTYNTLIYGFFADFFNLNKNFVEAIQKNNDTYIPNGFVESRARNTKDDILIQKRFLRLKTVQLEKFEENIAILKSKNIQVLLVYAPITNTLYNSFSNNSYFDSIMKSYNLPYYNFNKLLQLNDSLDFSDSHHLSQSGVNKFNSKLNEILKQ